MTLRLSRPEAVTMCSSVQTWHWSVVTSVIGVGKYCGSGQLGTHQMSFFLAKSRHYQCFSIIYYFVETVKSDRLGNFNVSYNVPSLQIFRFCFILAPLINFIKALINTDSTVAQHIQLIVYFLHVKIIFQPLKTKVLL